MDLARRLLPRVTRWPFALAWMALIFAGSSVPVEVATTQPLIPFDKMAHFGEYSVLVFLFVGVARRHVRGGRIGPLLVGACIVLGALYGASDEFHQRYTPGRDPALDDLAADVIGSTAGAIAAARMLPRLDPPGRESTAGRGGPGSTPD
jgi:VanZ family protein